MKITRSVLWLLCGVFAVIGQASDAQREADFAVETGRNLQVGEVLWLEAQGTRFLGLYTETEQSEDYGVAVIVHDMGGQPDQQYVMHALRTLLPEHRWATLALQMPVREAGAPVGDYYALFPEAQARIQAAIEYLKAGTPRNIVLIGYGLGSLMALYYQSEHPESGVAAIVCISLPVPDNTGDVVQTLKFISDADLPILDIYASLDLPEVVESARKRRLAARANNSYRQVRIDDHRHQFQHDQGLLVKRIYSWLRRVVVQDGQD